MAKKLISINFIMIFVVLSLTSCSNNIMESEKIEIQDLTEICEMATLECYYKNTVIVDDPGEILWWDTKTILWMEYDSIVKLGVDINELKIDIEDNVIKVDMPEAKVLSYKIDPDTLNENSFYDDRKGLFADKADTELQTKAYGKAEEELVESINKDKVLLKQARERAKAQLEEYINAIATTADTEYKIEWVSEA